MVQIEKISTEQQSRAESLADARGQKKMARPHQAKRKVTVTSRIIKYTEEYLLMQNTLKFKAVWL